MGALLLYGGLVQGGAPKPSTLHGIGATSVGQLVSSEDDVEDDGCDAVTQLASNPKSNTMVRLLTEKSLGGKLLISMSYATRVSTAHVPLNIDNPSSPTPEGVMQRSLVSCVGLVLGALVLMVVPLDAAGSATQEEAPRIQNEESNCVQDMESEVNTSSEPDPSMLACTCALGETCNGTKLYSQPCGTRVCGKDKYWYTCDNYNWRKETATCGC